MKKKTKETKAKRSTKAEKYVLDAILGENENMKPSDNAIESFRRKPYYMTENEFTSFRRISI